MARHRHGQHEMNKKIIQISGDPAAGVPDETSTFLIELFLRRGTNTMMVDCTVLPLNFKVDRWPK
jgi:hypothetical protein